MKEYVKEIMLKGGPLRRLLGEARGLGPGEELRVRGVSGSVDAIVASALYESLKKQLLFVARDPETAVRVADDLQLVGAQVHRLGSSTSKRAIAGRDGGRTTGDIESLRALISDTAEIIITEPATLASQFPHPDVARKQIMNVRAGEENNYEQLITQVERNGFRRTDFIEDVGDFSVRGSIIDIFPYVGENPIRIELHGDRIESLREFDPLSQRSIRELTEASIVSDLLSPSERMCPVFDYLRTNALIVIDEPERVLSLMKESCENGAASLTMGEVQRRLESYPRVSFAASYSPEDSFDLHTLPQPAFNGSIKFFKEHLRKLDENGIRIFIGCESQSELLRLKELLHASSESADQPSSKDKEVDPALARVELILHSLHEGFISQESKAAFFTEHQLFQRRKRRGRRARTRGLSGREVQQLRKKDFVVHADFGIGRFDGLRRMEVQSVDHEVMKIVYEGNDVLYVNLNYVNRVQKYSSKEGHTPRLSKLGTGEWQKLKARAKGKIKNIARDLIKLYAERKNAEGFSFHEDSSWQKELEASFVFEDTFDQAKATVDVKRDMEASNPMDRLICGDVGFGKTEVAVRAAFKAVLSGKQVAVLVPTTILALQHFNTFLDRLSKYSVQVESVSRLKTREEQTAILEKLRNGKIDIIIGTHRLLSKDVEFKDLGLLIVDEEHRFGVSSKEKLRQKKANVDTLTLTATPIPRTLHFSLMGARDLSLIATPPRNRLPIITEIVRFDEGLIRDAMLREVHRGGQVYVVRDRVQGIEEFTKRMELIAPDIRIGFAHGQMPSRDLEGVMMSFLERKLDVLVCTKIIESGLDIPNVNTIIINRADRFGMAELYQLRGRVGRSNEQAFAFLIAPPVSGLSREALRRLDAMREFTELGAGFNLAMRDLEIRGAGNLLGGEQSGFITNMGFETYTRTLEEAINELKAEEFQDIFEKPRQPSLDETIVEADRETLIPSEYIQNGEERLEVYRRLYGVSSRKQILEIAEELRDRFGVLPTATKSLLDILMLRLEASHLGFQKVSIRKQFLEIEVREDSDQWNDDKTEQFVSGINAISDRRVSLRSIKNGLSVRVPLKQGIDHLDDAIQAFDEVARLFKSDSIPNAHSITS